MVQEILGAGGGGEAQFCYQCLESTSSGRRLSFFSVSYPTTMTMVEGVAEMMRAERPFMRPQGPSSAISCLKVRMMELLPSTWGGKKTHTQSQRFGSKQHNGSNRRWVVSAELWALHNQDARAHQFYKVTKHAMFQGQSQVYKDIAAFLPRNNWPKRNCIWGSLKILTYKALNWP